MRIRIRIDIIIELEHFNGIQSTCTHSPCTKRIVSQAEHGADSQVLLIANTLSIIEAVQKELDQQLSLLPRNVLRLKKQKKLANLKLC